MRYLDTTTLGRVALLAPPLWAHEVPTGDELRPLTRFWLAPGVHLDVSEPLVRVLESFPALARNARMVRTKAYGRAALFVPPLFAHAIETGDKMRPQVRLVLVAGVAPVHVDVQGDLETVCEALDGDDDVIGREPKPDAVPQGAPVGRFAPVVETSPGRYRPAPALEASSEDKPATDPSTA